MAEEKTGSGTFTSILALLGFIVIIAIGIWGAFNAAKLAPGIFGAFKSPFNSIDPEIIITLPSTTAVSGEPLTISFSHESKNGSYAFSYLCRPGFTFQTAKTDGTYATLNCESPYGVESSAKEIKVIPISTQNRFLDVPFVVAYTNSNGELAAEGSAQITITNSELGASPDTTVTEEERPTAGGGAPTYSGIPDLTARILQVGVIDPATRAFVAKIPQFSNEIAAVRFEVANAGGGKTGAWNFVANLPTVGGYTFTSATQKSLNPGDRVEFTLQFDQLQRGSTFFAVHIDPNNSIQELSEGNNSAEQNLVIQ